MKLNEITVDPLDKIKEDFKLDHPDQQKIRQDCEDLKNRLPMFNDSDLRNTLELVLTYYVKQEEIPYTSGLHEVLAPFFLMGFSNLKSVFTCFITFQDKFLPRTFNRNSSLQYAYRIFHLLLLYHDPLLCSMLDGKHISPSTYAEGWFKCMFAGNLEVSLLLAFWEFFLAESNLTLPYFFALIIVQKNRDKILDNRRSPNQRKQSNDSKDKNYFNFFISDFEDLEQLC